MESLILNYISISHTLSYFLVFIGMAIGGEEVLFTVAFFLFRNDLAFLPTFIAVFFGALMGDIVWFTLGHHIMNSRIIRRFSSKITLPRNEQLLKHDRSVIFLSKFIYGFNHITLAKLAQSGEPFARFLFLDLIASLLWIFTIGGLGFASSFSLHYLRHLLRFFEIALALMLLGYFLLSRFMTPRMKNILRSLGK